MVAVVEVGGIDLWQLVESDDYDAFMNGEIKEEVGVTLDEIVVSDGTVVRDGIAVLDGIVVNDGTAAGQDEIVGVHVVIVLE